MYIICIYIRCRILLQPYPSLQCLQPRVHYHIHMIQHVCVHLRSPTESRWILHQFKRITISVGNENCHHSFITTEKLKDSPTINHHTPHPFTHPRTYTYAHLHLHAPTPTRTVSAALAPILASNLSTEQRTPRLSFFTYFTGCQERTVWQCAVS